MHTGRIGHPSLFDRPQTPAGASPVQAQGQVFTPDGLQSFVTPEQLSHDDVLATIDDFVHAARNAVDAGFDGVELHGANGYLLHQFVSTNANLRDDSWGGSAENRVRLTIEAVLESGAPQLTPRLREQWDGPFLLNPTTPGSNTGPDQLSLVETGATDLLSFGALFLANPDLPARLAAGGPYNTPDMTKAYGGDHSGYTDYPPLAVA